MITKLVKELSDSQLFSFSDWPNSQIPKVCAGVYTIYDENECLIYVGMAGAELTEDKIQAKTSANKKADFLIGLAHMRADIEAATDSIFMSVTSLCLGNSLKPILTVFLDARTHSIPT